LAIWLDELQSSSSCSFPRLAAPELIPGALALLLLLLPRTCCLGSSSCQGHPLLVLLLLIAQATGLQDIIYESYNQKRLYKKRLGDDLEGKDALVRTVRIKKPCRHHKTNINSLQVYLFLFHSRPCHVWTSILSPSFH